MTPTLKELGFVMVLDLIEFSICVVGSTWLLPFYQAGIEEYWLVDARKAPLKFDILRRAAKGYVATRKQADGWIKSGVFGRSFRLLQQQDDSGLPDFVVEMKP